MNMAAKGLTHFLLFWLFVAGVVGLFYRQEISEWVIDVAGDSEIAAYLKSDDGDDAAVEKAEQPATEKAEAPAQAEPAPEAEPEAPAATVTESAAPPQEPEPEAEAEARPAAQPAAEQASEPVAEPAAEPAVQPADQPAAEAEAQPVADLAAEPAVATPAEPETADAAEETAPAPTEETASAPAQQPAAPSETASAPAPMTGAPVPPQMAAPGFALSPELVRDWSRARDLYWRGDLAKAEEAYLSLVREHADEPDLAGEPANLLLQVGKHEDAAGFYLEAGLRMLRGPMPRRAGMVVGILNRLSPEKGDLLRKKMMEKMNPPAGTSN